MNKQSQSVNTKINPREETPNDQLKIPNFRSFAIKVTGSLQAHWGIEHYCLTYIPKFDFIVSADIQGCINIWSSKNFKKKFQYNSYDTDIFEILFLDGPDYLYVGSHHLTLYRLSSTGLHKIFHEKEVAPIKALPIENSNYFVISFKEQIRIWNKRNMSNKADLDHPTMNTGSHGLLHFKKRNLLFCGTNEGNVLSYDISNKFTKISSTKISKCDVEVTIGSHERLDLLITCGQSGFVDVWKLTEKNTIVYQTQIKVYVDRIYNYFPAIINNEDAVMMAGLSFELIVLYLGLGYKHERILNRKYSAILPIPEKKFILLGNNIQRDIDIATYP